MSIIRHESWLGTPAALACAGKGDSMQRRIRNVKRQAGVALWAIERQGVCICMCVLSLVIGNWILSLAIAFSIWHLEDCSDISF